MFSEEEMERMDKEYRESGQREKNIFQKFLTHIYQKNDIPQNTSRNLENKLGELYIHEKIYGVEGGTCWDEGDDSTHEVITSENKIRKSIVSSVEWIIKKELKDLNLDEQKLKQWMDSNVNSISKHSYIKDYFVAEYYGNSSNYGIYKINLNTLIEQVCSDKEKQFYNEALKEFTPPIKYKNNWR